MTQSNEPTGHPIPEVVQQMLFRVPAKIVYRAFADPKITTQFWFSHSDGRLVTGAERKWEWRMYGCETRVQVLDATPHQRLLIEWGEVGARSKVEWTFDERSDETTMVTVRNLDFSVGPEAAVAEALDSMGGFSLVLANAKALIEHGIHLNLIRDRAPDALVSP